MKASDRDKIAKPKSFLQGAWRNTRASHVTVNGYWAIYKNANNFPHSLHSVQDRAGPSARLGPLGA